MATGIVNPQFKILERLMSDEKTIRDPVFGDIFINLLECKIIDTEIFQRLRRIKQLGTVHLVFPGAEHSRFQHSLGTLHVAKKLLKNIENYNPEKKPFGKNEVQNIFFKLIVRLGALLHDLYEFPLSHTLEKEGHIFSDQWKNDELNMMIFGKESEIYNAILKCIIDEHNNLNITETNINYSINETCKSWASTILVYVYKIVTETNDKIIRISKKLFPNIKIFSNLFDIKLINAGGYIIRNTICADLLDYLARDFYFCGIDKKYDERFLTYVTFTKKNNDIMFAYSLLDKRGKLKHSVLSSLFDVLELRYSLAEIVHTHRVKNSFSCMVIEAFNFYYQSLSETEANKLKIDLMKIGDDELLNLLRTKNNASKYILDYYYKHDHYEEYILWNNWDAISDNILSDEGLNEITDAKQRLLLEKTFINVINKTLPENKKLQNGDILFYVMPNPQRLWKEIETNVLYSMDKGIPKTSPLSELASGNILLKMTPTLRAVFKRIERQRNLLMDKYKNLWRISLFLSPKIELIESCYSELPYIISELIEKMFSPIGIELSPSETRGSVLLPSEIQDFLNTITGDSRSYKNLEDLYTLSLE